MDANIHYLRQDIFLPDSKLHSIQSEAAVFIVGEEVRGNLWKYKLLEYE